VSMPAQVGVLVGACIVEFGLVRLLRFLRWRLFTPGPMLGLWLLFGMLGVPAVVYLIMGASPNGPAPGVAVLVALLSFPILPLGLGRSQGDKFDRLERQLLEKQQTQAWARLSSADRRQVRRCARRGQLHPDPLIAQISLQWASDYLERHDGLGWLPAKIVAASETAASSDVATHF
jgi:hypothetical protein